MLDQRATHKWLQVGLKRVRFPLGVNFLTIHIKRERLKVLCLLRRVLDGRLGPGIQRVAFNALLFCLSHIACQRVELAQHRRMMPGQDVGERLQGWVVRRVSRDLRQLFREGDPHLVLPFITHAAAPAGSRHTRNLHCYPPAAILMVRAAGCYERGIVRRSTPSLKRASIRSGSKSPESVNSHCKSPTWYSW